MSMRTFKGFEIKGVAVVTACLALSALAGGAPDILPKPDTKAPDLKKPVKVFFLSGQSNMCGMGMPESLKPLATGDEKFGYLVDENGNWTVRNDVYYIYYVMDKREQDRWLTVCNRIGPELGIGHVLGTHYDEVVLLIKGACGNRSLGFDFMPPSARKRLGKEDEIAAVKAAGQWYAGTSYDRYVKHAKAVLADLKTNLPGYKGQGYELAGIFWWQGHKDRGMPQEQYEELLAELIRDFRADFDAPNAPFVVATVGFNGHNLGPWEGVFKAQMAISDPQRHPEFKGNVGSVDIRDMGGGGFHYANNGATYAKVGDAMGRAMAELLDEAGSKTAAGKGVSAAARPSARLARPLAPGKDEALDRALMKALVGLSEAGRLGPRPCPLSVTQAAVSLVSVQADDSLTFRAENGTTATLARKDLKPVDMANLAVLVTQAAPESTDARAVAGVYMEKLGRTELADKYFAEAGPESAARMESFFQ